MIATEVASPFLTPFKLAIFTFSAVLAGIAGALEREVVAAQHHVLARRGDGLAAGRGQDVQRRQHQQARLELGLGQPAGGHQRPQLGRLLFQVVKGIAAQRLLGRVRSECEFCDVEEVLATRDTENRELHIELTALRSERRLRVYQADAYVEVFGTMFPSAEEETVIGAGFTDAAGAYRVRVP